MAEIDKRHFILGTAGHIDHGKTALVRALTGVDTDRLKEEKARGLTIDLGFAHMGDDATIIDVPGHEKFIKNMVAGVSTIDLVLFVVAADDGVMPQTREHLDILNLLQVKSGIIVITKKDLVDEEWLELVQDDIRRLVRGTFLEQAPVVCVSSQTGENIDRLKSLIQQHLAQLPPRHDRGIFWMPVDRSFVMKGFGTVVTGSVLSGRLAVGDPVEQLPAGRVIRVRGLQKHGKPVQEVKIGDRAAINLQGVAKSEIERGHILSSPGYFHATQRIQGKLRLLAGAKPLRTNTRIRLHLGTAEIIARVRSLQGGEIEPGTEAYVQFNLEKPTAARRLDPFVVRQYSPPHTIGGGMVLDTHPPPFRKKDPAVIQRLQSLEHEDPEELIREQLLSTSTGMMTVDELAGRTGMAKDSLNTVLHAMSQRGDIVYLSKKTLMERRRLDHFVARLEQRLTEFHRQYPTKVGLRKAELGHQFGERLPALLVDAVIARAKEKGLIRESGGMVALAHHEIQLTPEQQELKQRLLQVLYDQGFAPDAPAELAERLQYPQEAVHAMLEVLMSEKRVVRLDEDIYLHAVRVEEAKQTLTDFLRQHGQITVPEFKSLIGGASRKYAIPLLNYFDALEITLREGDIRRPGAALPEEA